MSDEHRKPTPEERDEPVVIPLEFDEAVKGLLQVDPDSEPVEPVEPDEDGG